ncbi:MAG: hypothetical protein P1P90_04610 [Patescibacteria group bacterium]|nr:hypothetical protein [Patescibacteria group bacterium]
MSAGKTRGAQFPVHYEDRNLKVYTNPSGEVFIEDVQTGVSLRICANRADGLHFTTCGRLEPILVTNMIGYRVEPRKP